MEKVLRGQKVFVDKANNLVLVTILKPKGNTFSLSDSIVGYIDKGYSIKVSLPNKYVMIGAEAKPIFTEKVKSKFFDSPPWYRYWFRIPITEQEQLRLW